MENVIWQALPFLTLAVVWIVLVFVLRRDRQQAQAEKEVQLALLSKFDTGEALARFLATTEGSRLFGQLGSRHVISSLALRQPRVRRPGPKRTPQNHVIIVDEIYSN